MRKKYQSKERKSNHKFEIVRGQELLVQVPLPMAEVWAEMQARVEELTGQAGLQILRAVLENEVTRRVGPPEKAIGHESQREPWLPLNQRSALLVSELTGFVAKKR